jgi:hypothetical protein
MVGDTVTVNGNGFTAASTVNIYWDSGTSPIATGYAGFNGVLVTSSSNSAPVTFVVPASFRGLHYLAATDSGSQSTGTVTFTVNSKITVTPATGGVGSTVTVAGTGFAPTALLQISFDGTVRSTNPATVTSTAVGSFSATITIPSGARGNHTILAADGGGSASANFAITQNISLSTSTAGVGDTIVIAGSGFSPSETITFKIDGGALTTNPTSVVSDTNGNFANVSFTVPSVAAGTHTITATDTDGNVGSATFSLLAKISITPATGTVGTQIAVTGSGFTPSGPVSIYWDAGASPIASTTASSTGTISISFTAPASAKGSHTVKAADTSGNTATAQFTTSSKIVLSPATGGYPDVITITFSGFTASSTVTSTQILSGSTTYNITTIPSTVQTDANGSATATFTVPGVTNGNWTVQASDGGGASAQATLAVTAKITLNTNAGASGDMITVTGTGFAANKSITMKFNGAALTLTPSSVTSDANGSFACQFTVPASAAGAIPVTATDGTVVATLNFTATAKATASVTTNQTNPGYVGMNFTINGTGFTPNATITVAFETTTVATVTSDGSGSFSAPFKIPAASAGSHTIHVTDGTTSQSFTFFMDSTAPAAPTLLTPTDKFKPKQPVPFTWNAVSDPSGVTYDFQISQDPNFGTLILEHTGLTTAGYTMTSAEKLKSAGSGNPYYWRVRAIDGAGNIGVWSSSNTFTIGFIWPSWMIHVWYGLGIIAALLLGLWLGRRMAYQSY